MGFYGRDDLCIREYFSRSKHMTTKPKTRKAPAAETGVNPKAALAAKIDEVKARARNMLV
jgi:hypothetical protein